MLQSTPALASAVGGLIGLAQAGAAGIPQNSLVARAAPAAIGAGIASLAAGGDQSAALRAAEAFGLRPAMAATPRPAPQMPMMQAPMMQQSMPMVAAPQMAPQMPMVQQGIPMAMPQAMPVPLPTGQVAMPQAMPVPPQAAPQQPPVRMARDGGYISGPGTGRSDSVPAKIYQDGRPVQEARLSDGEFVMTERAVRGAGNGDRAAGAARMYRLMREFEKGGRV